MKWVILSFLLLNSTKSFAFKCVAHRGHHEQYIENTIMAINSAVSLSKHDQKVEALEFDIRHTKDGFPVLLHDENLKRVAKSKPGKRCNLSVSVSKLSLNHIQDRCVHNDSQEIGTLRDFLFETFAWDNKPHVFLEFKDMPTKRSIRLIKLLMMFYPEEKIHLISFRESVLSFLNKSIEINPRNVMLLKGNSTFDLPKDVQSLGYNRPHMDEEGLLIKLKVQNVRSYVWTKNTDFAFRKYQWLGPDFVATDKILRCLSFQSE